MSTISSGTTLTTAIQIFGDTTGNLAISTGAANTVAMTIDNSQNVAFANAVTYNGTVIFDGGLTGNGAGLTSLNGSNVTSGTVAVARLATTGTPSESTFLRGDSAWAAVPSPNNGTLTMGVSGTGLSGSATFTADQSGNSTFTVASNATNANTAGAIVARDGSGNFSAGTITATLTGTASALVTGNSYQVGSFGVGTAASGTTGEIRATNNITAYYSDERLKTKIGSIENALEKVKQIETMVYHANETAVALGYDASIVEVGVTAQSVEKVQPQVVAPAPIDAKYLTVRYERLVPLLIEAIKELEVQVAELKAK